MAYTVGDVAKMAKVSVRTLHHYDTIGLLEPSERTDSGYRLYGRGDLERLQQVLFFKELGFALEDIRRLVLDPRFDRRAALLAQRGLLAEKARRTGAMLTAIDLAIEEMDGGVTMDDKDMFEVFGDFDPAEYEDEVKERWGDTDSYAESARRTKGYTKDDWRRFKAEQEDAGTRMIAVFDAGVSPDDPRAMDVAEEARLQIDKWFYPLSREQHVCLGDMYVADPRFKATYDKMRDGLAEWLRDAIAANARRTDK